MLNQVTHDPRAVATPSQLKFADARRERMARFDRHIFKPAPAPIPSRPEPWFCLALISVLVGGTKRPKSSGKLRIDEIIQVVSRAYDVTPHDILSARRTAIIVRPRQIAMYLAKTLTLKSLPEIGRCMDRDHTAVLFAIRKIATQRETDPVLSEELDALSHALGGRV